ncbi:hypothetical protein [Sphingobium chungbukense]|uniref:Uncharacterized protein n=1 Tax=Sphingobium chungbukense TaxID=56193 RepID=A0A0M3AS18_9SPHN|nr:hypothetical protein [Sphingobium chungbukense]KKW92650.1 hypothetical protein YP76_06860 [Sphingobium chungbukense]
MKHVHDFAAPNWRDQPVITDERLYQIERRACAAEWLARKGGYPSFAAWHVHACQALEDIDLRYEEGQRRARNAFWAAYDRSKRNGL